VYCQMTTSVKGLISGWLCYRWLIGAEAPVEVAHALKHVDCFGERAKGQLQLPVHLIVRAGEGEGRELEMRRTRRCDACVWRRRGGHQQHGQKLLRGKARALCNSLCISAHLYTKHHNVLRATCASLRTLAQHVHYHGSFGSRHVLPPPVLRQEGGGVNMTPIPHQSLCPRNG
jgi:hypothetical protein